MTEKDNLILPLGVEDLIKTKISSGKSPKEAIEEYIKEVPEAEPLRKEIEIKILGSSVLIQQDFFDTVIKELDKEIVGENPAREVILLCTNGKNVENAEHTSYNLLVNDESGSGKDHLVKSVGKLYLSEVNFIKRTRISPKVLDYWHTKKEEDWNWSGKVLYLEDISYEVLNNETMRTFLSSGSHTTLLKDQATIDKEVKGKPVVIFTTATITPKYEMLRRINILNLDTSKNQTKEIAKRKCRMARDGIVEEINPDIILALSKLQRIKVKIPFADLISKWIDSLPNENVIVILRTQIQTFLDYIKSATAFHQFQRQPDKYGYYMATEQDYEIGKRCFEKINNPFAIPLSKQQQKIIDIIKTLGGEKDWVRQPDIIDKITFLGNTASFNYLNRLADMGYLEKDRDKMENVDKPITIIKIRDKIAIKLPQFKDLENIVVKGEFSEFSEYSENSEYSEFTNDKKVNSPTSEFTNILVKPPNSALIDTNQEVNSVNSPQIYELEKELKKIEKLKDKPTDVINETPEEKANWETI